MKLRLFLLSATVLPTAHASDPAVGLVARHGGHEEAAMTATPSNGTVMMPGTSHMHGRPILQDPDLSENDRKFWEAYDTTNFFTGQGNHFAIYIHSILTFLGLALVGPIAMMLSDLEQGRWLYIPLQTFATLCTTVGIVFYGIYAGSSPDLYPGSVYGTVSLVFMILCLLHWFSSMLRIASQGLAPSMLPHRYELATLMSNSMDGETHIEMSDDGVSTECTLDEDVDSEVQQIIKSSSEPRRSWLVRKMAESFWLNRINENCGSASSFLFHCLNIPLSFFGGLYLMLQAATLLRMGMGKYVFALLAHFIKGYVFFVLGLVMLGRYFGAFSKLGMGWNIIKLDANGEPLNSSSKSQGIHLQTQSKWKRFHFWPKNSSAEYWESAIIFFYGAIDVFLEHLGNSDGVWSHKDIQHESIAFMFLGGGLCGMAIESNTISKLISYAFQSEYRSTYQRGYSINPLPAFTIFWTGALMSKHEQETALATEIHVQWGTLLSAAACFRGLTYLLLMVRKPSDGTPQRPFSEILVSFCLVCGGLIFALSSRETVWAMIYRGIDSMFTLNVGVGVSALILSYSIVGFAVKGLAARP